MVLKKILAICGSTRNQSSSQSILQHMATLFPERLEITIYTGIANLPHFNPDVDDDNTTPGVKDFREQIVKADGVIICTPEYVFSLPGTLKNAIEWTVSTTVFSEKPVALIVASGLGEKAYESLTLIMTTLGARIKEPAKLLIPGARSKINAQGQITDAQTLLDLQNLTIAFLDSLKA
jgi:NAD(P)H-dependent FMN reductase